MESSFHFTKSSENEGSIESYDNISGHYDFSQESLADIPHPDESCIRKENPLLSEILVPDDLNLPLPPGTTDCKLPPFPKIKFRNISPIHNDSLPPLPPDDRFDISINTDLIPMPDSLEFDLKSIDIPPLPLYDKTKQSKIEHSADREVNSFSFQSEGETQDIVMSDSKKYGDDSKYSPSKADSDDDNQDLVAVKPKVLGKEQAKKRLMAFSLSKQPNITAKKQNKIVTAIKTSKEKPPNPNKSSGVQEQFRATISAIEEEKKKMMQNMPNYLLLEMSELSKSTHSVITTSQKHKNENADSNTKDNKDENASNKPLGPTKSKESSKKSSHRSRSRSKSKRRSRSRSKRRSRSRSKRSRSKSRRRSQSKSRRVSQSRSRRRSRSRSRRPKEDKSYKSDKRNGNLSPKIKELPEDWKSFIAAGYNTDQDFGRIKHRFEEAQRRKDDRRRRSRTPNDRQDFKPIFNYLKKGSKVMAKFHAKPADPSNESPVVFLEKTIKYTRTKPMINWAENPSRASDFYMSKQMLLENCDQAAAAILQVIIENKNKNQVESNDFLETRLQKFRPWYPQKDFLLSTLSNLYDPGSEFSLSYRSSSQRTEEDRELSSKKEDTDKKEKSKQKVESRRKEIVEDPDDFVDIEAKERRKPGAHRVKRISLVNDSYLSDEEAEKAKIKEMVVGDVKVQLNLGLNCVKVRSKWDSDYEGDNSEKEIASRKEVDMEIATPLEQNTILPVITLEKADEFDLSGLPPKVVEPIEKKIIEPSISVEPTFPKIEQQAAEVSSEGLTGNLVSEYEEFLKMVSFDSNDNQNTYTQEKFLEVTVSEPKVEKPKLTKVEKSNQENRKKFEMTDWDQESDHDEKSANKVDFPPNGSRDEFLLLNEEKLGLKKKKSKIGKPVRKKVEKIKGRKEKVKKFSKAKKKKYEDYTSSDSSSDSYDSESDSDSVDSKSIKRKKKKVTKAKKKAKRDSSSESDSDTDDSKSKRKKAKKKKGKRRKSESSDSDEEMQNALLKQLDFKKQLIIKKIEEIDSISERSGKKKEKESRTKKKDSESLEESELLEKYMKTGKKPKAETKTEKDKKKPKNANKKCKTPGKGNKESSRRSKSSSDSDSDSSEDNVKRKKAKKDEKKKRDSSESSDEEDMSFKGSKSQNKLDKLTDTKNFKPLDKTDKKYKKTRKEKKKDYSSSDSDSDDSTTRDSRKIKRKGKKSKSDDEKPDKDDGSRSSWKENFILEEPGYKANDRQMGWGGRKMQWKRSSKKTVDSGKEGDDWEASSSFEESAQESKNRESSWDDEATPNESRNEGIKEILPKNEVCRNDDKTSHAVILEKDSCDKNIFINNETITQPPSDTLKNSLSNFSFNENSFCSFGQELSRDFFLTERSYSDSAPTGNVDLGSTLIEPRPFQSVSKASEIKKPAQSELYSPGYSDSDLSDADMNNKFEITNSKLNTSASREEVYDPLNCESEASVENSEMELSNIPLPRVSDILLPGEIRHFGDVGGPFSPVPHTNLSKNLSQTEIKPEEVDPVLVKTFTTSEFTPITVPATSFSCLSDDQRTPTKKKIISVKSQQKLKSKAASVFQDESDDETAEVTEKGKVAETAQSEFLDTPKKKPLESIDATKTKEIEKKEVEEKFKEDSKRYKKDDDGNRDRSRGRSHERERRRRRSSSREKRDNRSISGKTSSPVKRKRSRTPELKPATSNKDKDKREIRSDSFEIEPLKGSEYSNELELTVQPIPVLTGLGATSDRHWNRSLMPGYSCNEFSEVSGDLIDHSEMFDIYSSEDSKFRNRPFEKDYVDRDEEKTGNDKLAYRDERNKKERRKSRSRSLSPRKVRRSKSLERRRSPRRRSISPKRREKSPYSPRRRSPKRKSPSRRYRSSRSPERRRKSRSRSPRKRRRSPLRRSRSMSPRKHRNRGESPRRRDSPSRGFIHRDSVSPRIEQHFSLHPGSSLQNRIPVIGATGDDLDMDKSPSMQSSRFDSPMGFSRRLGDPTISDSELNNTYYNREHADEFGVPNYQEEVGVNNLITVKSHDMEKTNSPERLSLDQRIELELGVPLSSCTSVQNEQYSMQNQVCPQFQDMNPNHFQNSYNCDSSNPSNDNFYQNQMNTDFNGQYFNGHQQQSNYGPFPQYPNPPPVQSSVMQVGNIVEVVPTLQQPPPPPPPIPSKAHQIMQVGNVIQVVPSPKVGQGPPMAPPGSHNYGAPVNASSMPPVKTQKATAVVAPSSIVPTPNPEAVLNPLIKAIQLEREKRRMEKEKRKAEREARRKARQLRREAKLMSVNEKLKKSVQDEGLMLGQEVEDDELLEGLDHPSPPNPVEIITVSSPGTLPPAGKGILITAGFMPKPPSEKKEVKFADGVLPGEGTSTSGGEDIPSPPPKPKLPKEKRYRKKKTKLKKKVKVHIIKQIIHDEDDDDDDDLSPPPPPPGDPPPVFFARFPFAGDAQFPVYQTQTTTTTLTTVQYPAQTFQ